MRTKNSPLTNRTYVQRAFIFRFRSSSEDIVIDILIICNCEFLFDFNLVITWECSDKIRLYIDRW